MTNPSAPPTAPQEEHKPTIEGAPIFRGNRRIPASTLRARITTRAGDVYDEGALERDFMALWNTGFLDDVRLEVADAPNGNKIVTFYVREKKLVRSIDYKGLNIAQLVEPEPEDREHAGIETVELARGQRGEFVIELALPR